MSVMIEARDLGKRYVIGALNKRSDSFREAIVQALRAPLRRLRRVIDPGPGPRTIWALRDIGFDIQRGETVGIIGANGAGKSTLLKILSRITEPTCGIARIRGRLSSLLEVGTGFHPELTGRENIFLNGAILGMRKREIVSKFDEMVEFADIGPFLDTPVKRYSSGMYIRLAFAVAANLNPEILVVDEVLAVGDLAFQKKCLGKMSEVQRGGRTVLFVSHNMAAVKNLCRRTLWLEDGRIKRDGPTQDVIRAYLTEVTATDQAVVDLSTVSRRTGTGEVRLVKLEFLCDDEQGRHVIHSGDSLTARLHFECRREIPSLHFGMRIFSNTGVLITEVNTWATNEEIPLAGEGPGSIGLKIDFLNLQPGSYYIGVWASSFFEWHDVLDNIGKLEIEPSDFYGSGKGVTSRFGYVFLPYHWFPCEAGNTPETNCVQSIKAAPGSNGTGRNGSLSLIQSPNRNALEAANNQ
jgi:lipopolysaccharide transport system ATP-binding protein